MTEAPKKKERFCCWCGESLGYPDWHDKHDTCGRQECDREARAIAREEYEERAELAREDDYERY